MTSRAPAVLAFDHIHVFVSDRAAAETWYREVLGFTRTPSLESWAVDGGPLTLQNAGGSVHLALFERPAQPCRSTVALTVEARELGDWMTHLERATGHAPEVQDHGLSVSLYFDDPDGNPFEITTYDSAAARAALARAGA